VSLGAIGCYRAASQSEVSPASLAGCLDVRSSDNHPLPPFYGGRVRLDTTVLVQESIERGVDRRLFVLSSSAAQAQVRRSTESDLAQPVLSYWFKSFGDSIVLHLSEGIWQHTVQLRTLGAALRGYQSEHEGVIDPGNLPRWYPVAARRVSCE
jgi:hypothetical protein